MMIGTRIRFSFEGRRVTAVVASDGRAWFRTTASERESFGLGRTAGVRLSDIREYEQVPA